MTKSILTQKRLKELFQYAPVTGVFIRLKKINSSSKLGVIDNKPSSCGYISIRVDSEKHRAHRLAFLYMTGKWPEHQIDHENHIRSDNRWKNIRNATHEENGRNQSLYKNNTSGVVGVYFNKKTRKWKARIMWQRKDEHLGSFTNKEDAIKARKEAEIKYGFHKNHGK